MDPLPIKGEHRDEPPVEQATGPDNRIKPDGRLQPLRLGDSDTLRVGDWVVAIGNPFGLGHTVTSGIISAKYRRIGMGIDDRFIQTDASINPGNSGGPLLNLAGEVVGINSAIFTQSGGSQGIGFAIPINQAKQLLPRLHQGKVRRALLGLLVQDITLELRQALGRDVQVGALVSQVVSEEPAARAGIRREDGVVAFDGRTIGNARELSGIAADTPVDKETTSEHARRAGAHGDHRCLNDRPANTSIGNRALPVKRPFSRM